MREDLHRLTTMMNKSQRLIIGFLILLLVDIIWISSFRLTQYIYLESAFEKPFFSTYINQSMLTLYLLGLCFWPPWRGQCSKSTTYTFVDPNIEDENFYSEVNNSYLSDPMFVPIKKPENHDRSSGTESDDSSIRAVRFNKLAEVRHMSENDAIEALLARLSYQASVRAGEQARQQAHKFSIQKVAKVALMFGFILFTANYIYRILLAQMDIGNMTIISSTSSLFTLLLASFFSSNSSDKLSLSKLVAVLVNIFGMVLMSRSNINMDTKEEPKVMILSILNAFFQTVYVIFFKNKVDHEDRMDIPMFFGFVGLFNLTLLWPIFFILHYGHWEEFEWPNSRQWTFIVINGIISTVLSEVLWLWSCFLTSSLIGILSGSLLIPMSMIADVLLKKIQYPHNFYVGLIPMIFAFSSIFLLSYYENWDPVLNLLKYFHSLIFRKSKTIRVIDLEAEQSECLIGGVNSVNHEA
ncbi:solute carrier family 35 member F5 isoform X2 [Microplitis demolitor]|uniref:solute carrier family 35 member F5 isoform X2 n=1 Tax=Microplitis demolitor TaxID=69319 RepID=UPI0004CD408D|nr:solute carrier family 35 member F5 isoform X2 [Microplitis demolitor]